MKNIKQILIIIMGLMPVMTVRAQWAGEDKQILRSKEDDQTVTLSVINPDPDACYKWTGPNIQTDPSSHTITANPQERYQQYRCTRLTAEGVDQDNVLIEVLDSVKIVSVVPTKGCFQVGDELSFSDFEIVTEPPEYKDYVDFTPRSIPDLGGSAGSPFDRMDVEFFIDMGEYREKKIITIDYINPDQFITNTLSVDFMKIEDMIKDIRGVKTKTKGVLGNIERAYSLIEKAPDIGYKPLEIKKPEISVGAIHYTKMGVECCNDNMVKTVPIGWDGFSAEVGLEGRMNWPTPIPEVFFLLTIDLSASVTVGQVEFVYCSDPECRSTTISVSFDASASIGAGVSIFNPNVLNITVGARGAVSVPGTYDILNQEIAIHDAKLTVSLFGHVDALWGILEDEYEWVLLQVTF